VRHVVLALLMSVVATACAGGGSSSSGSVVSMPRSTSTAKGPAPPGTARLGRGFGDEVGLTAKFPAAWYAQPYASSNLLITSFPVHVDDGRVWQAIPAGGTAIQIYDQPSGSVAGCKRLGGRHAHVRLGRYETNYEGIGAAFRTQFHDHGHTVLVFTSFGGTPPTAAQHLLAERILNSIRIEPGACPVKDILALGERAERFNRLLTQAARREAAAMHSRRASYTPMLSTGTGPAGTTVTITGAIPPTGEDGQPVHLARLIVWWNLDPHYPSPVVTSRTAARPGRSIKLTTIPLTGGQGHYRAILTVPRALAGSYLVDVLQEARDGSVAQIGSVSFTVTARR
jgi:hypothetical protein